MIKLNYDRTNINVNKLHDELGDLGEQYFVTSNDSEMTLMFPDLFERSTDVLDEQGNIIDANITYEKKTTNTVTEIVDDVEIPKEVDTFTVFDFEFLKTQIQAVIDVHDPTPIQLPKTELEQLQEVVDQLVLDKLGV